MPNIVSSTVFCMRNVNKAERRDNDVSRASVYPVILGQLYNSVLAWDDAIAAFNSANKPIMSKLSSFAKEDKIIASTGKMAKLAGTFVNPLICVASAADALTSDDKPAAVTVNGSALLSMFASEHVMKKHFTEEKFNEIEGLKTVAKKISEVASKFKNNKLAQSMTEEALTKMLPKVAHGGAFVAASIGGYALGSKFGKLLVNTARGNSEQSYA